MIQEQKNHFFFIARKQDLEVKASCSLEHNGTRTGCGEGWFSMEGL